jgi:hypothetical protein
MRPELKAIPYVADVHYPMIAGWWKAHGKRGPRREILPTTGAVVQADGRAVAASFVFLSNSVLANIGFTVADPAASPRLKLQGVLLAIETVEQLAVDMDFEVFEAFSDEPALSKIFASRGYDLLTQHDFLFRDRVATGTAVPNASI